MYKEEGNRLSLDKYSFESGQITRDININACKFNIQLYLCK